jgi:predicted esterase
MLELCDTDTLVAGIAPRAFMLTAGEHDDIFPIDGVRQIVEQAKAAYQNAGVAERFQSVIFPAGHSLLDEIKTEVYQFLDHWLK